MAVFVQGFWFGGKPVRVGKASAGDVVVVSWACLSATSSLQTRIPQPIVLVKGISAEAARVEPLESEAGSLYATTNGSAPRTRAVKLAPNEVALAYPSRPGGDVLSGALLFLPALELASAVGSSGSGKSTIAHLCGTHAAGWSNSMDGA